MKRRSFEKPRARASAVAAFATVVLTARLASAVNVAGPDTLSGLMRNAKVACSNTSSIDYVGGTGASGELAMVAGIQLVEPLERLLDPARVCSFAHPERSGGRLIGHAASVVTADADAAAACGAGIASSKVVAVSDLNGIPGLQCPGCIGGSYVVGDSRDALRVLFTGMHHDAAGDLPQQNCKSDVRYALAQSYVAAFQGACTSGQCATVRHLFRPDDYAPSTDELLTFLGLPGPLTSPPPFCNGTDVDDLDPIRRPCADQEQVCEADGTLGLMLPVRPGELVSTSVAYASTPCSDGRFMWGLMPFSAENCPNGRNFVFGKCLVPVDAQGKAGCLLPFDGTTPVGSGTTDPRVYNLVMRTASGPVVLDAANREMDGAFHRIHTTTAMPTGTACARSSLGAQLGCLSQASPCSLSLGDVRSNTGQAGVVGLPVGGIAPSLENIRKLQQTPVPADAYPLARNVYFDTLTGQNFLNDPAQSSMYACFSQQSTTDSIATASGLAPLGVAPKCVDFDERQCGASLNADTCQKQINFCPFVTGYTVLPLQTGLGGSISVQGTGEDPDDPPSALQYLWTATGGGTFADPHAATTTYTCTVLGTHTLTFEVWDGGCGDTESSIDVTCVP